MAKQSRTGDAANGFVIMPFRNDPDTVKFWKAMREAAERFEHLTVQRFGSDSLTQGHDLFDAIRNHIHNAAFCLADFTIQDHGFPNLNVLTEAGIALGAECQLYVIARARSFSQFKRGLPSDWSGQYVEMFSVTDSGWSGAFFDFFEKILRDLDVPTTQTTEKPRPADAHAHQMRWIMGVVDELREQCRDLYGDANGGAAWFQRNTVISGQPERYAFPLSCPDAAPGVSIYVGAFFDSWQRGGTPFGLEVATSQDADAVLQPVPVEPLNEVTTDEAVATIIAALDAELTSHTPDLSKPTPLARVIGEWREAAETIRSVFDANPDLPTAQRAARWTSDGLFYWGDVAGSRFMMSIGIDLELWHKRGRSPCWIIVEPRKGEPAELLKHLKLPHLRALDDSGSRLVPVPMDGDFAAALKTRVNRVVKACKSAAAAAAEADEPDDTAGDSGDDEPLVGRFDDEKGDTETLSASDAVESASPDGPPLPPAPSFDTNPPQP